MTVNNTTMAYLYLCSLLFSSIILVAFSQQHLPFNYSSIHGYTNKHKHYIVYMGSRRSFSDSESVINANHELLASHTGCSVEHAKSKVVYHYHKSLRGFSAFLTPKEANKIRRHDSVVSVFESKTYKLQTIRSWDFLLEQVENSILSDSKGSFSAFRENPLSTVIVGHLDSGILPELENFSPEGLNNIFQIHCDPGDGTGAPCNGKMVVARFYPTGHSLTIAPLLNDASVYFSPRDDYGHGTHTASIALGRDVRLASFINEAYPTLKGGAPDARIAVYKCCWHNLCEGSDVIAAFDDAVFDGVHLITMSLGSPELNSYFNDPFSIGSFHAYEYGILTVASAGNDGENGQYTVGNTAPWMLTVAATSTDRDMYTDIKLGNGMILRGYGYNINDLGFLEVILAADLETPDSYCYPNNASLNASKVSGKIVVCFMDKKETLGDVIAGKSQVVRQAGGVGMILVDWVNEVEDGKLSYSSAVSTSVIEYSKFLSLLEYMKDCYNRRLLPAAAILLSRMAIRNSRAPNVASFSSKGPNPLTPEIIKPDIAAPGESIIAAWPHNYPPPTNQPITRPPPIIEHDIAVGYASGTSMACPHIAGIVAVLIGSFEGGRRWSPAMLKSALMTTATWLDNTGNYTLSGTDVATPFDYGSGHVVPDLIFRPGLVYDMRFDHVIDFLCTQADDLSFQMGDLYVACSNQRFPAYNLNYPSIAIKDLRYEPVTVQRTVTWLGDSGNHYQAFLSFPSSVSVKVEPTDLYFTSPSESVDYFVTFYNINAQSKTNIFGSITWADGYGHIVRTPFALMIA